MLPSSNAAYYSSDDEDTVISTGSIIQTIRGRTNTDFVYETSRLMVSGYMTKRARGRHVMGKLMATNRRRWFELRVDEDSSPPAYCLLYFKGKGHGGKQKGCVRLSAFDVILQSEDDLSEITLHLDRDNETSHQTLTLKAEDEECAETWIQAFQGAILSLNRLTTVVEEDEEEARKTAMSRQTSMMIDTMGKRERTSVSGDVNWSKGGGKAKGGISGEKTEIIADHNTDASPKVGKRQMVKDFFSGKCHQDDEEGGGKFDHLDLIEKMGWGGVSGNHGNSTSGRALMHAMLNEWKPEEELKGDADKEVDRPKSVKFQEDVDEEGGAEDGTSTQAPEPIDAENTVAPASEVSGGAIAGQESTKGQDEIEEDKGGEISVAGNEERSDAASLGLPPPPPPPSLPDEASL